MVAGMLVWINGPFGGGKTQTAFELHRRLPGSLVCDPELVGYGMHRMIPTHLRNDFQEFPAWRQGVFEVLDHILTKYDGVVLAPMTVVEPKYFAETVGRLREQGHDVRHFALLAEHATVQRRLHSRELFGLRPESWALERVDRCLAALREPEFAEQLWTDNLSIRQVAEHIADRTDLTLTPNTDGELRGRLRRAMVSVKHIRLG